MGPLRARVSAGCDHDAPERAVDRGGACYRRMMRARRLSDTARSEVMLAIAMIPVLILVVLTVLHLL